MTSLGQNLKINGDRLWDSLMEMAKIGPGVAGGNNRQTLTDEDAEGRALLQRMAERVGLSARGYHRVLRVSRTIADLEASDNVRRHHVAEALSYRLTTREPA